MAPQNVIAEHEIRNISCAAQDPEDLCTFAYITKDLQTSHHYCHVFSTVDVVGGPVSGAGEGLMRRVGPAATLPCNIPWATEARHGWLIQGTCGGFQLLSILVN